MGRSQLHLLSLIRSSRYHTMTSGTLCSIYVSAFYVQASDWLIPSKKEGAHQTRNKICTGGSQSRTYTHGTRSSAPAARCSRKLFTSCWYCIGDETGLTTSSALSSTLTRDTHGANFWESMNSNVRLIPGKHLLLHRCGLMVILPKERGKK